MSRALVDRLRGSAGHQADPFSTGPPSGCAEPVLEDSSKLARLADQCVVESAGRDSITAALREWFRIVHISLQRDHVHMLVEADHKAALARGMQGFQISAARNINTALGDGVRRSPARSGEIRRDPARSVRRAWGWGREGRGEGRRRHMDRNP